jgi:restriction system protein
MSRRQWIPAQLTAVTRLAGRRGWRLITLLSLGFAVWLGYRYLGRPAWPERLPVTLVEILSLSEAAAAFTLSFLWLVLGWRAYRRGQGGQAPMPALSVEALYALSPADFERYVGRLFRRKGYRVRVRGRSGDLGVDLEITRRGGKRAIVQCKRYRHTVGAEVVRELYGTLIHERVAHAFLVTTADISDAARKWAAGKPMTLIDGDMLAQLTAVLGDNPIS